MGDRAHRAGFVIAPLRAEVHIPFKSAGAQGLVQHFCEDARDTAPARVDTEASEQSRRDRKRVEMQFARLKHILTLGCLRLLGRRGAQDKFTSAAIAQNLVGLQSWSANDHGRPPPVLGSLPRLSPHAESLILTPVRPRIGSLRLAARARHPRSKHRCWYVIRSSVSVEVDR